MATKKPEISILIVNYRQEKELNQLLECISKQLKKSSYEILIFDNSFTNSKNKNLSSKQILNSKIVNLFKGNFNMIASQDHFIKGSLFGSAEISLYTFFSNIGYAGGINYLATKAIGSYYIILNPDVEITGDLNEAIKEYKTLPLEKGLYSLGKKDKQFTLPIISKITNNCRFSSYGFIIHKHLFKSIGGFDIKYFMYFEDDDLALKLKKFNIKSYFPKRVYIKHNKTYKNMNYAERKKIYYESLLYFLKKTNFIAFLLFFIPIFFLKSLFSIKLSTKIL